MRGALGFITLAAAAGSLIGVTQALTRQSIDANELAAEAAIVAELLGTTVDPDAATRLCHTEVRGYAGTIKLIVLPRKDPAERRILEAVRVISHRETPGIGDFIELRQSDWMRAFSGLTVQSLIPATVAEWDNQLDAVTGATITRRAIIEGVASACPAEHLSGTDPLFRDSAGLNNGAKK